MIAERGDRDDSALIAALRRESGLQLQWTPFVRSFLYTAISVVVVTAYKLVLSYFTQTGSSIYYTRAG